MILGIGDVSDDDLSMVKDYINEFISQYNIPPFRLMANLPNQKEYEELIKLYRDSLEGDLLDELDFDDRFCEKRIREGMFKYILVLLTTGIRLKNERAIYGACLDSGLVILRWDRIPVRTRRIAVRHEFAHLFDLENCSNPGCLMNWECIYENLCSKCKKKLNDFITQHLL